MSEFFNDNGVPRGAFVAAFAVAGPITVENFRPNDPSKVVPRPNTLGGPNGWSGVDDQMTGTATVQIPDLTGSKILKGDYFIAPTALHAFKWVVTSISDSYEMEGYWKQEVSFHRAYFT